MTQPTGLAFTPDGRMLILERLGTIKVVQPGLTQVNATPFLTLSNINTAQGERGLVGITLDPDFATNGYYYVFYTADSPLRDRISRFTASGNGTVAGSEVVIWQDNVNAGFWHHGGTIAFGPDGKLYASTGDHFDQTAGANHVSQKLTSYHGKILRLNKDGTIPTDNPFYDGNGPNLDAIWAYGLRNPFRFSFDSLTGTMYIGDVGESTWEELNKGVAGANYGWPICEGTCGTNGMTNPLYSYNHNARDASITAGFMYRGSVFPAEYYGTYFFADYAQNWIKRLAFNANGTVSGLINFEPSDGTADGPYGDIVDLKIGSDGALYYVHIALDNSGNQTGPGSVHRISYTANNQPPVITNATANPTNGAGPTLQVSFTAAATDPENDTLTYTWDFGDTTSSPGANVSHTYQTKGRYTVRLSVSDATHTTLSNLITITVGTPPQVTINTPSNSATFKAGDVINFSGTATDADGVLTNNNYAWTVNFHHDTHVHPAAGPIIGPSGTYTIPTSGHDYSGSTWYEFLLTVTDSNGISTTQTVGIYPQKVNLTFQTSPSGLALNFDQLTGLVAPFVRDTLVNFQHTIQAPLTQTLNGVTYQFVSWSDGGSAQHILTTPATNQTYTATYQAVSTVTNCGNDAQFSSLLASGGTIVFNCNGTGAAATILLTSTKTIGTSVTIDGGGKITLSGGNARRLFNVNAGITLTLANLSLINGNATGGGAVFNDGNLVVQNSAFSNNTSSEFGGAIKNNTSLTITNSVFTNNTAPTGYGGAIDITQPTSSLNITNSTFDTNSASIGGGAIASNGNIVINGSTFKNNSTASASGGSGGGAIETTGSLTVDNSTFNNNTAGKGGAIYNEGSTSTITNSTFAANSANVAPRSGGAIHNQSDGSVLIVASTFSGNMAPSGSGGTLYNTVGNSMTVRQSILADGSPNNCAGLIAPQGNNLETGTDCSFTTSGSLQNTNPQLGPLANNGGFTPTMALGTGSPAINAGNDAVCPPTDQRGVLRPQGSHCDIGAYEVAADAPLPSPWTGGVSITSNKNVVTVGRPHIGSEVASYDGFAAGSLSAYVPMLFKNAYGSYDSALYVQNVHASNTANITLKYYDSNGVLNCTQTDIIAPLSSKGYWLPAVICNTGSLPDGWVGGVVVTSNQPIVAVGRPHVGGEVMTYDGFSAGSLSAYVPMLFNGAFGGSYNAAFYLQNTHASNSASITIKYYNDNGVLNCTKADTLAPLASKGYWVPTTACDSGSLPPGWVGGVLITSNQPIVALGRPHIGTQVTTYNGFAAGSLSSYVPMLFNGAFGGTYNAAFYLQNTHASNTANITIKYYNESGLLNCTKTDTIAPLASKGYWVPSATCDSGSLPAGWAGGVIVTSDQPIVAVGRPHIGSQVTTYNGFTGGSLNAYLPMLFKAAFGTYNAAFYIQNTENSAATVSIKFYDTSGNLSCTRAETIPALSTLGYWVPGVTCVP